MPQQSTTVRFDDDLWALLTREASAEGISAAQFVRDAAVLRLGYLAARRGDERADGTVAELGRRPSAKRAGVHPALSEPARLAALERSKLLDGAVEERFDRLTQLASRVLNAPVALVSLVTDERQHFKSCLGLPQPWADQRQTPLSHSFCQHVVVSREPLVVSDAREHPELRDNLAIPDIGVVAYLGIPLITSDGSALGSFCVIDSKPRHWTKEQVELMQSIAATVVSEIERA